MASTKAELQETLEGVENLVDEALDPELTREELVAKVKEISGLISGEDEDEVGDDEDEDEDEDE